MADYYELTHEARIGGSKSDWQPKKEYVPSPVPFNVYPPPKTGEGQSGQEPAGRDESTKVCYYCLGRGHWKPNYPLLKQKATPQVGPGKPPHPGSSLSICSQLVNDADPVPSQDLPFICSGFVSLLGSTDTGPV